MDIKLILTILFGTIFINNFVLTQMLGLCPFIGVTRKLGSAAGMGFAVTSVMTTTSLLTFLVYKYVLIPYDLIYLRTISFIIIIALQVQIGEILFKRISPALYHSLGIFLPLVTTNCIVLGVAIMNINSGLINSEFGLIRSIIQGFGGGVGFTLALLIMAGIRERLELAHTPENLKGLPISFITAGLIALAFLGFAGFKI
jgi:electron transport complex protein RnfA